MTFPHVPVFGFFFSDHPQLTKYNNSCTLNQKNLLQHKFFNEIIVSLDEIIEEKSIEEEYSRKLSEIFKKIESTICKKIESTKEKYGANGNK